MSEVAHALRGVKAPTITMVGNAHIDPVWIWNWREGYGEIWATFRSAVDRLRESPELVFSASSAAFYAWIEAADPDLFSDIVELVREGRWSVVGGMWIEPDCNLPSGESLCRQLLLGQRYFSQTFGSVARVGYNIDSFGHQAGLPQLLREGGLRAYVMMRPSEPEKELPAHLFWWRDASGAQIATFRIAHNYETDTVATMSESIARVREIGEREGAPQMCFFGVGNHGGGPTKSMIMAIDALRAGEPDIAYGDPDAYFSSVGPEMTSAPVVESDLQHHAVGCYSVSAWAKRANRQGESNLLNAEALDVVSHLLCGRSCTDDLTDAWRELALCQFHDILAGTASHAAFESVASRFGFVTTTTDRVMTEAVYRLARRLDTRVAAIGLQERESPWSRNPEGASPFVVVNPLAWPVRALVRLPRHATRALDSTGVEIPLQAVSSGEATIYATHSLVDLSLAPLGHEVVWLQGWRDGTLVDALNATTTLETDVFSLTVDERDGRITSLVDRRSGRELVGARGVRPQVRHDPSDTWSHGVVAYDGDEVGIEFESMELIESGPLRWILRLRFVCCESRIIEDVHLYADCRYVDLRVRANWEAPHTVVKIAFPLRLGEEQSLVVGAAYSHQERTFSGEEDPFQDWIDVSDGEFGVGLVTDHLYGYDAGDGEVRVTYLRNPVAADHGKPWARRLGEDFALTDSGEHDATIRIIPHEGDWRDAHLARAADTMHRQPVAVADTFHAGDFAGRGALLEVTPSDDDSLQVVKRAADGSGVILRFVEPEGQARSLSLRGAVLGRDVAVSLKAFEVATVLVPDDAAQPIQRVSVAELPLDGGD
ncbi:MAG: glycoside hydrolase family 38 C-terminal domain-containing protein [Acidimicrobiales bacterium]